MASQKYVLHLLFVLPVAFYVAGCGGEQATSPSSGGGSGSGNVAPSTIPEKLVEAEAKLKSGEAEKPTSKPVEAEPKANEADKPGAVTPKDLGAGKPEKKAEVKADGVSLVPANWAEFQKHVVPTDGKKFTLVDAWATWCAPCKENFPHVVEMNEKYGPKGLQVISLSMDDLSDKNAVKEATEFLISKKAEFKNLIMNEPQDVAFEKLDISAIPSVFLYDASGKEIRRFTLEDPNNQFTYAQVEQTIEAMLAGKPLPEFKKSEKSKSE